MADENVIDTLKIKVEGDGKSALETLDKVVSTLEKIKGATQTKSVSTFTNRLNSLQSSINNIKTKNLSKLNAIFSTLSQTNKINISPRLPARIRELGEAVDSLSGTDFSRLNEMASGLSALSRVGHVNLPRINGGRRNTPAAEEPIPDFNGTVDVSERFVSDSGLERTRRFSSKLSDIREKIKSGTERTRVFGQQVRSAFSDSIVGRFGSKLKETIGALGRIALYRIMRSMIKQVTDAFKTGIDNMYQYSKTFNGSYARSMDELASANLTYKNSIGAIMAPLIEVVTPWLDTFLTRLVEINNTIAMVIAGLSGKSTYSKAVRVATEYAAAADKAETNTGKVTERVKELKRSLAGLDEITIIGENQSPVSSVTSTDPVKDAGLDYSSMFVETPVDMAKVNEIKEKFEDILTVVGLIGAGILAWNFAKAMTGLSDLKSAMAFGLTLTLVGATLIFKGIKDVITDGMDWENFWTLVFGGTALTAGTTVLGRTIGKMFGTSGGAGIGARVGAGLSGAALGFSGMYDIIMNSIDSGRGDAESTMTSVFSTIIGGALLGTAVAPGIGTAIGAVVGTIAAGIGFAASNPETIQSCIDAMKAGKLAENVDLGLSSYLRESLGMDSETAGTISGWFSRQWAQPMEDLYNLWDKGSTWFKKTFIEPVEGFFSNLWTKVQTYATIAYLDIQTIWSAAKIWFSKNVTEPIKGFFSDLWTKVQTYATIAYLDIQTIWSAAKTWFSKNVTEPIKGFFSDLWSKIQPYALLGYVGFQSVWGKAKSWFSEHITTPIKNLFSGLFDDIKLNALLAYIGMKSIAANAVNWVISKIESGINGLVDGINWFIGKFNSIGEWASGVTGQTFYFINEIQPVALPRVSAFKNGGFPDGEDGLFYANHNELIGQFTNGRTAVANNEQIVEGIEGGVSRANEETNQLLNTLIKIARQLLAKDSTVNVSDIVSGLNRKNQRDGKVTVPIST